MIRINQLKIRVNQQDMEKALRRKAAEYLHIRESEIKRLVIVRQSIDARKKPDIFYSYVVDVEVALEEKVCKKARNPQVSLVKPVEYRFPYQYGGNVGQLQSSEPASFVCSREERTGVGKRPVIIGIGPAGLFCGYYLAKAGFAPILLERGEDVDTRIADVERFWQEGTLNPESNVAFGEGGAGTFSDGKLNTLVKDKDGRNMAVLRTFVEMGAKDSILYEAKPHIGTDGWCSVVKKMRQEIIRLGGQVRFGSKVTGLQQENGRITAVVINETEQLNCSHVVLAIGHSARDTFEMLHRTGIAMEAKSFAVGLRVEHPQDMINESQYGLPDPGMLGAAAYKVTAQTSVGRGVYSFCMCPGGYVVNASSEEGRLAVNGMSYSVRDGVNANSAIIVAVTPEDYGAEHPLSGIHFQRKLEERAYQLGHGKIPVQRYGDFKRQVELRSAEQGDAAQFNTTQFSAEQPAPGPLKQLRECDERQEQSASSYKTVQPANKGGHVFADVSQILPQECNQAFVEGMAQFGRMIPGFDRDDALLSGVESRTSSPIRIHRDETLQSSLHGLYPCGEGAGYAGGITSAAMDGIRVAEAVAASICGT